MTVERTVLGALDRLGASLQAAGDLPGAIRATERRLDLDPLDEAAHVRLMELLAASGDRSAALRQYRACVAILDRELGVEPLATTTARYEAIRDRRRGATSPGRTVVAATPSARGATTVDRRCPSSAGTGPSSCVRAALVAPADGDGRLVAIRGEAGIGKTRLAEAAAADVRSAGGDGPRGRRVPGRTSHRLRGHRRPAARRPGPARGAPPGSPACRPRPARSWPGCCRPSIPRAARPSPVRHRPARTPGSSPPSSTG